MSAYSQNVFALLSEDGDVRPPPVKEEKKKVETPKAEKRSPRNGTFNPCEDKKRNKHRQHSHARVKNDATRPRREFDRHSGTGLVDSEKKINQGWGHAETAESEATIKTDDIDLSAQDVLKPKDPVAPESPAAVVEPEVNVKTLDEYLAEKANKALKVSRPEARKANDDDSSAFKGAVALEKESHEDYFVSKTVKSTKKTEKTRKEKVFVEIEQRFEDKTNNQRGRRNNTNTRRNNTRRDEKTPALNDAADFPSLGAQ
ncbi:hypothetical protein BDB01DRAFT_879387 [Pilobolus umbonatus]|nr:hypothetical protein BDB01DRAFT_879387 [Pilobolus umbonatus]